MHDTDYDTESEERSATASSNDESDGDPVLPPNPKRHVIGSGGTPLVLYSSSEDDENDTNRGNQPKNEQGSPLRRPKTKWDPTQTTGTQQSGSGAD